MNKKLEKRNTLYTQAQELVQKAEKEERLFTDEERTSYQSMVTEIRSLPRRSLRLLRTSCSTATKAFQTALF